MVRVKICGITDLSDARAALDYGADALGFVFAPSARRVTPKKAAAIIRKLGPWVTTVGVFVNEKAFNVKKIMSDCGLSTAQLHGDETRAYTRNLGCCKVIKAFRIGPGFKLNDFKGFPADAYLFDTQTDVYGGSGRSFDWRILAGRKIAKPVIVSGGLNVNNVREVVKLLSPYGVDVSSSVEKKPGVKDHSLLKKFISHAKQK